MRQRINTTYRSLAGEFAREITAALGSRVNSVVLYGSVARKQARKDSDVDLLVIGDGPDLRDQILDAAYALMETLSFETFISVVYFDRQEFYQLVHLGSPFVFRVLKEGLVLYDDGTFARSRPKAPAAS